MRRFGVTDAVQKVAFRADPHSVTGGDGGFVFGHHLLRLVKVDGQERRHNGLPMGRTRKRRPDDPLSVPIKVPKDPLSSGFSCKLDDY